jgi:hypothetical protein
LVLWRPAYQSLNYRDNNVRFPRAGTVPLAVTPEIAASSGSAYQGLENRLLMPLCIVGEPDAPVKRRERLGGMLSYNHRKAA